MDDRSPQAVQVFMLFVCESVDGPFLCQPLDQGPSSCHYQGVPIVRDDGQSAYEKPCPGNGPRWAGLEAPFAQTT